MVVFGSGRCNNADQDVNEYLGCEQEIPIAIEGLLYDCINCDISLTADAEQNLRFQSQTGEFPWALYCVMGALDIAPLLRRRQVRLLRHRIYQGTAFDEQQIGVLPKL